MKMDKRAWTIFGILIALVLVIGGFLIYKYYFTNKNNNEDTNQNNQIIENKFTDNEKNTIEKNVNTVTKYLGDLYPLSNINIIDKQRLLNFAVITYSSVINKEFKENSTTNELAYSIRYFLNYVGELEGNDIKCLKDEEILYKYTKESDSYALNETHKNHNDIYVSDVKLFPIDYKLDGNKLEFTTKILYKDISNTAYYKTYKDAIDKKNPIINKNNITNEDFDAIKDDISITTFKLQKIDKNFVITSVSIN